MALYRHELVSLSIGVYLYAITSSYYEAVNDRMAGQCMEHGVKYTVYLISVTKQYCDSGHVEQWDVCRRYSDFHDFHMLLQEKVTLTDGFCHLDDDDDYDCDKHVVVRF